MSKIAIVTDSTAYLPLKWIEQYDVQEVPLRIHWGNDSFLDGVDITPRELYARLSHGGSLPTTSQPSLQNFLQVFENLSDKAEGIVVPLISSGISGTVESARAAAREFFRLPVEIVDTRATSSGQILVILAAARAAEQGKSLQEVKKTAEDVTHRVRVFFAVDTLEYLHRGGRINRASRYLGTALDIKPILFFDLEGKIDALERVRTKKKALGRLIALAEEYADGHPVRVGIVHANASHIAKELQEEVVQRLNCLEVFTVEFSPVIGIHVGPGTIGIALYAEDTWYKGV